MKERLAILGGSKVVTVPPPHYMWPIVTEEEIEAVVSLMRKGEVSIWGRKGIIKDLEEEFSRYHNIQYALAMNSGTAALHAAYFGVGVGPGDEVIAPTNTFVTTVTPILQTNGIPVLCDSELETGNIDPDDIRKKVTENTKAIVVTHLWGHPVELDEILNIAREHNLMLIEDCSHALGATYKGKLVGTFGDVACISLGTTKILTGGCGGILLTNNQEIYERATLLGFYRMRPRECIKLEKYRPFVDSGFGLNYEMHPFAAAMIRIQFRHLGERIEMRRENLDYFSKMLKGIRGIEPPVTKSYVTRGAYYGYKPTYKPEELRNLPLEVYVEALQAEGVDVHKVGSAPLHMLPLFQLSEDHLHHHGCPRACPNAKRRITYNIGDLPISERIYARSLSLPTFTMPAKHILGEYVEAFDKVAENIDELSANAPKILSSFRATTTF